MCNSLLGGEHIVAQAASTARRGGGGRARVFRPRFSPYLYKYGPGPSAFGKICQPAGPSKCTFCRAKKNVVGGPVFGHIVPYIKYITLVRMRYCSSLYEE